MARRFYFASTTAAQVSPAYEAWNSTASAVRRRLLSASSSADAMANGSAIAIVGAPSHALDRQFVSEPVAGGENLNGSLVRCYARAQESNMDDDIVTRFALKVVSNDGATLRATYLALGSYGTGVELTANVLVNAAFYVSAPIVTSYVLQRGDRIVAELGYYGSGASMTATGRWGAAAASDLPQDEASTSDLNPWLWFSSDIVMLSDVATVTAVGTYAPTTSLVGQEG